MNFFPPRVQRIIRGTLVLMAAGDWCSADEHGEDRQSFIESAQQAAAAVQERNQQYSHEFHVKRAMFVSERDRLREALQEELLKLGSHASRHQVAETVERFEWEHASDLADQVRRGQELAADLQAAVRADVPEAISDFHTRRIEVVLERHNSRASYQQQLASLQTNEARDALSESFREDQRNLHRELKDSLKTYRNEIRSRPENGDRQVRE